MKQKKTNKITKVIFVKRQALRQAFSIILHNSLNASYVLMYIEKAMQPQGKIDGLIKRAL